MLHNQLFQGTEAHLNNLSRNEKMSAIFNALKCNRNEERLFDKFLDPITMEIMDQPVKLNDVVYDYSTLIQLPIDDKGFRTDPLSRFQFSLSNLGPARELVNEFHDTVAKLHHLREKKSNKKLKQNSLTMNDNKISPLSKNSLFSSEDKDSHKEQSTNPDKQAVPTTQKEYYAMNWSSGNVYKSGVYHTTCHQQ